MRHPHEKTIVTMPHDISVGDRFNKLTVLAPASLAGRKGRFFLCRCDCGSEKVIYGAHLKNGSTKGCGCARKGVNRRHGMTGTSEYKAWDNARHRCRNPANRKFPLYGGRGIKMCERWANRFDEFIRDMGPKPSQAHSLDRINSDGDYEPGNCRWATWEEQNNNRSSNRRLRVHGRLMTVAEASRATGLPHGTILERLDQGWSDTDAIRAPKR